MAFVPAENTVMVEFRMLQFGEKVENTIYVYDPTGFTDSEIAQLAVLLEAWWTTNVAPLQSSTVTLREIYITALDTQTSPAWSFPVNVSGVGANPAMPGNVTLTVTFKTNGRGRSARGRNYIVGLTEIQCLENDVVESASLQWQAAYTQLLGDLAGAALTWVVMSRFSQGAPRVTALIQPVIAAIVGNDAIDSQRRRLKGRGR